MAPSKSNLMKAGSEGFAMLDEYFRQKGGSKQQQQQQYIQKFQHQPPKSHCVQVIVPVPEAKEAAKFYGGTVIAGYPHVVQVIVPVLEAKEAERINCYEAAKLYGGTVIAEYPNTKKPSMRYMP